MNQTSNPFTSIFHSLRASGLCETFFRLLHRFRMISVLHTFEFVFREIAPLKHPYLQPYAENNEKRIIFREIYEFELNSFTYAEEMYSIDTLRMHFSKGLRFFAALNDREVIAVNGLHPTHADLVYIKMPNIKLPEKIGYFNCALTAPAYRNCSIGTKLRQYLIDSAQEEGFKGVVAAVFIENKKALRWNLRNGFQYWGRISYIKFGNQKFWLKRLTHIGRRRAYILNNASANNKELMEKIS